jgi:hypothetical protein
MRGSHARATERSSDHDSTSIRLYAQVASAPRCESASPIGGVSTSVASFDERALCKSKRAFRRREANVNFEAQRLSKRYKRDDEIRNQKTLRARERISKIRNVTGFVEEFSISNWHCSADEDRCTNAVRSALRSLRAIGWLDFAWREPRGVLSCGWRRQPTLRFTFWRFA